MSECEHEMIWVGSYTNLRCAKCNESYTTIQTEKVAQLQQALDMEAARGAEVLAENERLKKQQQSALSMKSYYAIQAGMFAQLLDATLEELEEGLWSGSDYDYEHEAHIPLADRLRELLREQIKQRELMRAVADASRNTTYPDGNPLLLALDAIADYLATLES